MLECWDNVKTLSVHLFVLTANGLQLPWNNDSFSQTLLIITICIHTEDRFGTRVISYIEKYLPIGWILAFFVEIRST
jgi:hypothetical protein